MNRIDYALIFKALGDAKRLQIVQMLFDGAMCACRLLEKFEITQPTLSHHMKILCECGIVIVRKEGNWSHYSLSYDKLSDIQQFIVNLKDCNGGENK